MESRTVPRTVGPARQPGVFAFVHAYFFPDSTRAPDETGSESVAKRVGVGPEFHSDGMTGGRD